LILASHWIRETSITDLTITSCTEREAFFAGGRKLEFGDIIENGLTNFISKENSKKVFSSCYVY